MDPIKALQALLVLFVLFYLAVLYRGGARKRGEGLPGVRELGLGFVTNFFDTLGIGSYAPTTAALKAWKMVKDEWIPGTLNVGHTPPVVVQAFIFIGAVTVDVTTLFSMIAAAVVGAYFGARVVASWPRRNIQIGMGSALLVGAGLFVAKNLGYIASRGEAVGATGLMLLVGIVGSLVLGALMTIGIGFYAPCMLLVAFMGMNERSAFPIMMGACAFLMAGATKPFVDQGSYNQKVALGLLVGGLPAVAIASRIVTELPIVPLRWVIAAVVLYTGVVMLRSAHEEARQGVVAEG